MKGLKITLFLVLVSVFALCDSDVKQFRAYNYGQNPLIQSRGLDILSLRKNENLVMERQRRGSGRNVVYPAQTYDNQQSQHLRTESSSMNLRGNLREEDANVVVHPDSSDVERYRIHTHVWRTSAPQASEQSRSRGVAEVNEILERSEEDMQREQREADAENHRITHQWRPQDQPQIAERSRNINADSDEVINAAEEARLREQRAADAERYRINTHHWRPQDQPPQYLNEANNGRSRNIRDTEDDVINRAEEARLQELREQESSRSRAVYEILERSEEDMQLEQRDAESNRITHHWRPQDQQPSSEQSSPSRSRNVYSESNEEDLINTGEDARLQQQQHQTHVWRPQYNTQQRNAPNDVVYQEGQVYDYSSANARTVEDQENDVIARAEEARLQEQRAADAERYRFNTHHWRPQDQPPQYVNEANNFASRSRNIRGYEKPSRNVHDSEEPAEPSRIHTHVWRQEPYQEQEQREADIARAIRARNMRSTESDAAYEDEARVRHGQHFPDTPFQEYENDESNHARSYQARDVEVPARHDYHVPRGMQLPQANPQNVAANRININ